jgi:hypothetical protein
VKSHTTKRFSTSLALETLLPPKEDVPIVEDGDMTDEDSGTVTPEDAE